MRDNILLAFRMLQLLKIVFNLGKELLLFAKVYQMPIRLLLLYNNAETSYKSSGLRLAFLQPILCPKMSNSRKRISKMKYWIENI